MSEQPEQEDIDGQFALLATYRRTLGHYLQQRAQHGGDAYTPPVVMHGIGQAREEIARIKADLRRWGQQVDDLPGDMEHRATSAPPRRPPTPAITIHGGSFSGNVAIGNTTGRDLQQQFDLGARERNPDTMSESQLRAVLWDMDGTLLDSAEYHWLAWRDAMAAEGRPITREEFQATFGQRNDTILRGYFGPDLPDSEIARIGGAKEEHYRRLVRARGIELLPGVPHFLAELHSRGWKQAIASAAPRANIETILEELSIAEYFDTLVSAEDVQRGKPDPQVFLLAADRVGVPPQRCVVVEDAPAGLEAARRAGMRCIGVRTSHSELIANIVVDTIDHLPDDAFERLLELNVE